MKKSYFQSEDKMLIFPSRGKSYNIQYTIQVVNEGKGKSSGINTRVIKQLCDLIKGNYNFDGFIVLHKASFIEFTSSALTFALENNRKPVIFIKFKDQDQWLNSQNSIQLKHAIKIASSFKIPEVCILEDIFLYRAVRVSRDINCRLKSPNYPPLGEIVDGAFIADWDKIRDLPSSKQLRTQCHFSPDIGHLILTPFLSTKELDAVFKNKSAKSIVVESYGLGNFPSNRAHMLEKIKNFQKSGGLIYTITQCFIGRVEAVY